MPAPVILITTLAEYQTRFWLPVGQALARLGREAAFLSFDDRSSEMLRAANLKTTSFTEVRRRAVPGEAEAALARAGPDNVNFWLGHERVAFARTDAVAMREKLALSILAAERAMDDCGRDPVMVQELGGFLSVVGSFFAARARGIDNWFIEPSFFRGRFSLTPNSFGAPSFPARPEREPPPEAAAYLEHTLAEEAIVIPAKDRHQYRPAWSKVVNVRNARRLVEKLIDKHLFGKRQEFGHIGQHVRQHARMLANSRKLRRVYRAHDAIGPYLYYPFHVPGDVALTLRAPEYLDQLALVDYLCRTAPQGLRVAVKEHPAMIGAIGADRLLALARSYDNLAVLPPATNNYRVIQAAEAVITVNSKSGAEAGLVGKPVVVLGDAFYRAAPFATPAEGLAGLETALARALAARPDPAETQAVVWRHLGSDLGRGALYRRGGQCGALRAEPDRTAGMTIEAPPRRGPGATIFFMDLIRGVASQLVVVGHSINIFLPAVFMVPTAAGGLEAGPGGIYVQNLAVLIFFYVSGYLITATFLKKSQNPGWRLRHFLADRAARIFTPLAPFLLILLITDNLVFGSHAVTRYTEIDAGGGDLVRNLTMLFNNSLLERLARWTGLAWLSGPPFGSADQLWTVVIEWWIYVLFGLVAFWLIRRRGNLLLWLATLAFALVVPLAALLHHGGLIVAWIVGMAMRLGHDRLRRVPPAWLAALAGLSFALAATRWALTAFDFYDPLTAALLGIALFAFMTLRESGRARILPGVGALVTGLSNISYSLYLVHLTLIFYVAHWLPGMIGQAWALPAAFLLCNAGAIVFYYLFERHYPRVRRWLDPYLDRPSRGAPAKAHS